MHIFVTGATGWVGSVLVPELISAGHHVVGLARTDAAASSLVAAGAEPYLGSLQDLESLRSGAAAADAVVHLGFVHDFSDIPGSCETDRKAIEAMGEALAGTHKPLVITSGTLGLALGQVATETDGFDSKSPFGHRAVGAQAALALVDKGVRVSIVRLPPTVHGKGDHGFIPRLVELAREKGVSGFVGDGANRWPAVHRVDAAHLFRLAVEKAPAGAVLHGVAEEGVPAREIAGAIGKRLGVEVASKPANHFGFLGFAFGADNPTSSLITRETLGWEPTEPGLLADIATEYDIKA
ncbi:hypothetical protein JCM1840_003731 [Sporobolomyces johnsonii]